MKTPLIVCGFVRSGTRMVADILNKEGRCCLQGEIPHAVAVPMLRYMKTLSKYYRRGAKKAESFLVKQHEPFERIFESATQSRVIRKKNAVYFGHKTPKHERYFRDYEASFSYLNARYIYCQRNPLNVWRSLNNMSWNPYNNVQAFVEDWKNSQAQYRDMKSVGQDRVYMFDLDRFIESGADVISEIFQFLELEIDPEKAAALASLPNTNSSKAKMGREPNPLRDADVSVINDLLETTAGN